MTAPLLRSWKPALEAIAGQSATPPPDLAIILGSGLAAGLEPERIVARIPYAAIPGLPEPTVSGHTGELLIADYFGWTVWGFSGRFHLYEGYTAAEVARPVELAAAAAAPRLLLTNAAGAINPDFPVHAFMCIADQINLSGDNPLIGVRERPFLDLSAIYRTDLYQSLFETAAEHDVPLCTGVLASVIGPTYETPAEIRALRVLGADAVSMSTVHEAIVGRYHGLEVAGLSFMSNPAAGCGEAQLDHQDVLEAGQRGARRLRRLLLPLVRAWQNLSQPASSQGFE